MINAARENNPARFKEIFEEEIGSRIGDALQEAKADMVAEMFGVSGKEITEDNQYEEVQLDEVSKKTLASYVNKAAISAVTSHVVSNERKKNPNSRIWQDRKDTPEEHQQKSDKKMMNRLHGIKKATARLAKEEYQLDEQFKADTVAEMFGLSESQKMKSILDVNFLGFNREDLEAILRVDYPGTRVLKVHGKGKMGRAGQIIYKVDISDDTIKDVETAKIYLMFNARTGKFQADF